MYTVKELRKNSWEKLRSAGDLLKTRKFNNAVYLCGYAVELGLKARICVDQGLTGWPVTKKEFAAMKPLKLMTHDFEDLLLLTKQDAHVKRNCLLEWSNCLQWSPDTRYQRPGTASRSSVEEMMRSAEVIIRSLSAAPGLDVVSIPRTAPPFVKLWGLAHELEVEMDPFTLFAICQRSRAVESADLVVSAGWLAGENWLEGAQYLAKRVGEALNDHELKAVSGLIVLPTSHLVVSTLTSGMEISGDGTSPCIWENPNLTINEMPIERARVIKCQRWRA